VWWGEHCAGSPEVWMLVLALPLTYSVTLGKMTSPWLHVPQP